MTTEQIAALAGLDEKTRQMIIDFINSLAMDDRQKELIRLEHISTAVAVAGTTYDINDTPSGYTTNVRNKKLIGIGLTLTKETELVNSTFELYCDGREIFSPGTPAKTIFMSTEVGSNQRFFDMIHREINQSRITGRFTDGAVGGAPYTMKLTLMVLADKPY